MQMNCLSHIDLMTFHLYLLICNSVSLISNFTIYFSIFYLNFLLSYQSGLFFNLEKFFNNFLLIVNAIIILDADD